MQLIRFECRPIVGAVQQVHTSNRVREKRNAFFAG
jgi:hypothetical protein